MRSLAPIAMSAFSAMALTAGSTLAMPMLVSSANRNDASPKFGRIGPPRRVQPCASRGIWMGDWFMLQTVTKDLIFWMDAWLSC